MPSTDKKMQIFSHEPKKTNSNNSELKQKDNRAYSNSKSHQFASRTGSHTSLQNWKAGSSSCNKLWQSKGNTEATSSLSFRRRLSTDHLKTRRTSPLTHSNKNLKPIRNDLRRKRSLGVFSPKPTYLNNLKKSNNNKIQKVKQVLKDKTNVSLPKPKKLIQSGVSVSSRSRNRTFEASKVETITRDPNPNVSFVATPLEDIPLLENFAANKKHFSEMPLESIEKERCFTKECRNCTKCMTKTKNQVTCTAFDKVTATHGVNNSKLSISDDRNQNSASVTDDVINCEKCGSSNKFVWLPVITEVVEMSEEIRPKDSVPLKTNDVAVGVSNEVSYKSKFNVKCNHKITIDIKNSSEVSVTEKPTGHSSKDIIMQSQDSEDSVIGVNECLTSHNSGVLQTTDSFLNLVDNCSPWVVLDEYLDDNVSKSVSQKNDHIVKSSESFSKLDCPEVQRETDQTSHQFVCNSTLRYGRETVTEHCNKTAENLINSMEDEGSLPIDTKIFPNISIESDGVNLQCLPNTVTSDSSVVKYHATEDTSNDTFPPETVVLSDSDYPDLKESQIGSQNIVHKILASETDQLVLTENVGKSVCFTDVISITGHKEKNDVEASKETKIIEESNKCLEDVSELEKRTVKDTDVDYYILEKDDIEDPGWEEYRKNASDHAAYEVVRKRWNSKYIINPHHNLTVLNSRKKRMGAMKTQTGRNPKRKAEQDPTFNEVPSKRQCTSSTFLQEQELAELDEKYNFDLQNLIKVKQNEEKKALQTFNHCISNIQNHFSWIGNANQWIFMQEKNSHCAAAEYSYEEEMWKIQEQFERYYNNLTSRYQEERSKISSIMNEIKSFDLFYTGLQKNGHDTCLLTEEQKQTTLVTHELLNKYDSIYSTKNFRRF